MAEGEQTPAQRAARLRRAAPDGSGPRLPEPPNDDVSPEPPPAARPEPPAETRVEPEPEPAAEPANQVAAQPEPEATTQAEREVAAQAEPAAAPGPESEAATTAKAEKATPAAEAEIAAKAEAEPPAGTGAKADADVEPDSGSAAKAPPMPAELEPAATPRTRSGRTTAPLPTTEPPAPAATPPPPARPAPPAAVTRHARPGPRPRSAARRLSRWAHGPVGRLVLPALLLVAMVGGAGAAGAWLIPATAQQRQAAPGATGTATPTTGFPPTGMPTFGPTPGGTLVPTGPVLPAGRPADVLIRWAEQMSTKTQIPQTALQAYGYAELVLNQTTPGCQLKWTTLAAIGKVESNHGRANNASLLPDGRALPPIRGAALDGTGGRARIPDTDTGLLDGDTTWDHAVGPMQFIPSTWKTQAMDADNDGTTDPNDIDDAALAAAKYLCRDNKNLSLISDWWSAILTYNAVQPYAQAVYDAANEYGVKSRT